LHFFSGLPGGNRNNNGNFNNIGNNGIWWSSTENSTTNAWNRNLNYNSTNVNRNNNNKENGFSVRCLRDLMEYLYRPAGCWAGFFENSFIMQLSLFEQPAPDALLNDLFQAYFDARKNKRNTMDALAFEKHFEENLFNLATEICSGSYKPGMSICFIVNKPVKREILAAEFRDRVVHHLLYNYISPIFEKIFINDCYSCRKGKGTHYGIERMDHFIRSCSKNYSESCYILKLDIRGYFMSINREVLYEKVVGVLIKNRCHIIFNLDIVLYLLKLVIFNDPTHN
jgi:hypothetical protein